MRTFITVIKSSGKAKVLSGPSPDYIAHRDAFNKLLSSNGDAGKIDSIEIWSSSRGVVKRKKFFAKKDSPVTQDKKEEQG